MNQNLELAEKILDTISKISFLDRRRVYKYKKISLYPSEIHLLLFVHYIQDTNITEIANRLGLTKGAISQTLSRLKKKEIIVKETDPKKKNELSVTFTDIGKVVIQDLIKIKKALENEYLTYLQTLSEAEKQTISDFLDKMASIMNKQHA